MKLKKCALFCFCFICLGTCSDSGAMKNSFERVLNSYGREILIRSDYIAEEPEYIKNTPKKKDNYLQKLNAKVDENVKSINELSMSVKKKKKNERLQVLESLVTSCNKQMQTFKKLINATREKQKSLEADINNISLEKVLGVDPLSSDEETDEDNSKLNNLSKNDIKNSSHQANLKSFCLYSKKKKGKTDNLEEIVLKQKNRIDRLEKDQNLLGNDSVDQLNRIQNLEEQMKILLNTKKK